MDSCPVVSSDLKASVKAACPTLVLASQSPNRRRLLEDCGVRVIARPQDIDEICGLTEPAAVVPNGNAGMLRGRNFMARAPPSDPMTMIPSRPRLMTPECSEKQPPRATRMRIDANINVYWISNSILSYLPSCLKFSYLPVLFTSLFLMMFFIIVLRKRTKPQR